jgi:hypothetical protein
LIHESLQSLPHPLRAEFLEFFYKLFPVEMLLSEGREARKIDNLFDEIDMEAL